MSDWSVCHLFKIWSHILKPYRPLYGLCFFHQLVDLIWLNLLCHPQQSYNIPSFLQNNNPHIITWYKKKFKLNPLKLPQNVRVSRQRWKYGSGYTSVIIKECWYPALESTHQYGTIRKGKGFFLLLPLKKKDSNLYERLLQGCHIQFPPVLVLLNLSDRRF